MTPQRSSYLRARYLIKNYGITQEQFDYVLAKQSGACALCKKPSDKPLDVDMHKGSKIPRGLLCHRCKMGIAYLNDDSELLSRAIEYFRNFENLLLTQIK